MFKLGGLAAVGAAGLAIPLGNTVSGASASLLPTSKMPKPYQVAFERLGVRPDLVTLAKGLANGLPIGALLVADSADRAFVPGDHGSTFGGNPVSAAAAGAVVEAIDDELLANVGERAGELTARLAELPGVESVRGRGLLIGVETAAPAADVVAAAREKGLLVLTAGENVVRLAPPLTVGPDEVAAALEILARVVTLLR